MDASYRWLNAPRWYLWEGGFLLIASAKGVVPAHSHHAIQVVIAVDGSIAIAGDDGQWHHCKGMIVRPDVSHSFDCNGALGAMVFVDPESNAGAWLTGAHKQDITIVPEGPLASPAAELRAFIEKPFDCMDVGALIHHCIQSLTPRPAPARRLDERVSKVIDAIRTSDDLRMSLDHGAELAFLSPSRFAHLFKEQLGLPFSRYMLWRKLTRAMVAIGANQTIADAAQAADFADAAHLTRTFNQMFGMAPSILMKGEFAEIASPFAPQTASRE